MPLLKKIVPVAILGLMTTGIVAVAGEKDAESPSIFAASDTDSNGVLGAGEFLTYAQAKAADGDTDYTDVVAKGDYDIAFAERDVNADGVLDEGELGLLGDDMTPTYSLDESAPEPVTEPEPYQSPEMNNGGE